MLITETVHVDASGNVSYYENLGYKVPKHTDKNGNLRATRGSKIAVKVLDLSEKSAHYIEYECNGCKKVFKTKYFRYVNNTDDLCKSCSMKKVASDKENIKKKSGINHPRYNHELTDEEREVKRSMPEYITWRKAVYEECSYTCQCCMDNRGGNLIAHHLNGWHWAKEERFLEHNGVTLCENCHDLFHKRFGYKNNTKEQFIDFIIEFIRERNQNKVSKVFDSIK